MALDHKVAMLLLIGGHESRDGSRRHVSNINAINFNDMIARDDKL